MIDRLPDWLPRMNAAVEAARDRPFDQVEWFCALFVADVVEAMTSTNPLAEYRGRFLDETSALAVVKATDGSLRAACRKVFGRQVHISRAHRGDVVMQRGGATLGVCLGATSAFVGDEGLVWLPTMECVAAFPVGWNDA